MVTKEDPLVARSGILEHSLRTLGCPRDTTRGVTVPRREAGHIPDEKHVRAAPGDYGDPDIAPAHLRPPGFQVQVRPMEPPAHRRTGDLASFAAEFGGWPDTAHAQTPTLSNTSSLRAWHFDLTSFTPTHVPPRTPNCGFRCPG
ncbi:hypothetical protein GCM10018791_63110 [Streptomyces zaomyceticus]|nr:hypothetical protein GCM10018791_63110 [Streptomyces zaomyceticus]